MNDTPIGREVILKFIIPFISMARSLALEESLIFHELLNSVLSSPGGAVKMTYCYLL